MAVLCFDRRTFDSLVLLLTVSVWVLVQCGTKGADQQSTEKGFAAFKQDSKVERNESAPSHLLESSSRTTPNGVIPLKLETLESPWHESVPVQLESFESTLQGSGPFGLGPEVAPKEVLVEELKMRRVTPLKEVGSAESSLVDRILTVEGWICSAGCGSYPHNRRVVRWGMCQGCHCDTMCHIYRDCCPDAILRHNITYDIDRQQTTACIVNRAVPYDLTKLKRVDFQTMVTLCPSETHSRPSSFSLEEREKCENPDVLDREQSFPVSSPLTGFTYRNIFCARCHNDSLVLDDWGSGVECYGSAGALISDTHSRDDLYRKLVTNSSVRATKCEMVFTRPSPTTLKGGQEMSAVDSYERLCTIVSPPIIDVCNATGLARYLDAEVEEACALYDSIFDGKYRNMFCYLCNQEHVYSLEKLRQIVQLGQMGHAARVTFAALLDFGGHDSSAERVKERPLDLDQCGPTQFFDVVECKCRELECSEGKYLDSNGTCQSLIISDLFGYKACFQLDVSSDSPISDESLSMALFDMSMAIYDDVKRQKVSVLKFCPNGFNISLYIEDQYYETGSLQNMERVINATLETYIATANENFEPNAKPQIITVYPCLKEVDTDNQCSTNTDYFVDEIENMASISFGQRKNIYYIDYTQTSTCAFASLSINNFSREGNEKTLKFVPTGGELPVSRAAFMVSSNSTIDQVRLCLPDYKQVAATAVCEYQTENFEDTWTISGIVSIVCTSVSLLCLALTFITYLLLAPLRTGAGKNIMVLTALLFIAQALYEFAIEQYENRNVCRAIGIAIHYSWLAAVFSMNACTVERFLKLCYPLQSRSFFLSKTRPFVIASSYSLLCPLAIVAINIVANLKWNSEFGYGSPNLCYITSRMSRIVAFAVPMGIVVLVNVVLLGVTMWRLRRQAGSGGPESETSTSGVSQDNNVHSTKSHKVGLLACVKLSVVTGITWLLAFLYEAIPYDALSYIITALIGLQGLLFFLSMVVNKRVLGMCREAVASHSHTSTTSSGSHTKKNSAAQRVYSKVLNVTGTDSLSTDK